MIQRLQAALRALAAPPDQIGFTYKMAEDLKEGDVVLAYLQVRSRRQSSPASEYDHVIFVPEKTDALNSRMLQSGDGHLWSWGWPQNGAQPFMVRIDS